MSKIFKITLASMFAFAVAVTTASATTANLASNLTMGSKGANVQALQVFLNSCADTALAVPAGSAGSPGYESMTFGPATQAAVMKYQTKVGVNATGYFGPMSASKASTVGNVCGTTGSTGSTGTTTTTGTTTAGLPAGCTSAVGFSPTTGASCAVATTTLPAGCTSAVGFSPTTGASCAVATTTLPAGCTSATGFSPTTGASCSTGTTTTTTTTGTLSGEGSVKDFSIASADKSDFSEGQSKVELIAFDVELDDDGSLKMDRFDLYMGEANGGAQSSKPWDYFKKAYLMVNGTEVASMDVDSSGDWDEYDAGTLTTTSQEYKLRFSGMNTILDNDETAELTVAFDIVSGLDSDDETADWQYGTTADSFRLTDSTGFVFTDGEDLEDNFGADTADEAAIDISEGSSNPDASVIEVDNSSDTLGKTIAVVELEETEDLDVNITEMTVTLATSDTITDVVKKAYLYDGSTLIGSESVSSTTVTFDNLDYDLKGDSKQNITVKVDFDDTDDQVRYQDGDTISVSAFAVTEFTDEMDNDEGDITPQGSFVGKTHTLYANGLSIDIISTSTEVNTVDGATNDNVTFKITFKATALGNDDVYINKDFADVVTSSTATDLDQLYAIELSTGTALTSVSGTIADDTNATEVVGGTSAYAGAYNGENFYKISDEETFTITITGTNQTDSKQVRAYLSGIEWTTDNVSDTGNTYDATPATINTYTSDLADDSKTPFKLVN